MRDLNDGIMACIGNTPMVRLTSVQSGNFRLFAKLEGANPGGSIKDRPALEIIRGGIEDGRVNEDTVIIEATSGNMGIGLAQICCYLKLKLICVVDTKVTPQNLRLLKTYGATIEVVTVPDPITGDLLQARINRAKELASSITNSYWSNQYANVCNARAHLRTMAEVMTAMEGEVDYVFCASSSCGTIRGCADYLHTNGLSRTRLYVADSPGSVIFGGTGGSRLIPGHGAGIRPDLYREGLADRCIQISDMECVAGCRLLLSREALLVGGSSGGILMAVNKVADEFRQGSTCVMLFPDRGERYLDTVYSDLWVKDKLGFINIPQDAPEMLEHSSR